MKPSGFRRSRRVLVTKSGSLGRLTVAFPQERGCDVPVRMSGGAEGAERTKVGFVKEPRETLGWLDGAHEGSVEEGCPARFSAPHTNTL